MGKQGQSTSPQIRRPGPWESLIRQLFLCKQINAGADSGSVLEASWSLARLLGRSLAGPLGQLQDGGRQVASDTLQQMFPPGEAGANTHIHSDILVNVSHSHAFTQTQKSCVHLFTTSLIASDKEICEPLLRGNKLRS